MKILRNFQAPKEVFRETKEIHKVYVLKSILPFTYTYLFIEALMHPSIHTHIHGQQQ